jgi:uncharacterized protein YbjT (DUF2867 family)
MGQGILVTGATGNIGYFVAKMLVEQGEKVRAAVTNPHRSKNIIPESVDLVRFDFLDQSTYREALEGINRIFLVRPPVLNHPEAFYPFIDEAKRAGVKHMVFVSLLGVENNPFPPHYKIEKFIVRSGIPYTFLRPSFFMQNLHTAHRLDIQKYNDIFIPAGNAKVSFIDTRDIGEAAACILTEPDKHQNRGYSLTGPDALTYEQASHLFTKVLGRTVTYSKPSMNKFRKEMIARGLPKGFVNVMAILYLTTRFGMAKKVTQNFEFLLGRKPTSLEQYIRDHADYWK